MVWHHPFQSRLVQLTRVVFLILLGLTIAKVAPAREFKKSSQRGAISSTDAIPRALFTKRSRVESLEMVKWLRSVETRTEENLSREILGEPARPDTALPVGLTTGLGMVELLTEITARERTGTPVISTENSSLPNAESVPPTTPQTQIPACLNLITANVVAIDRVIFYNRFGAFNPAGMLYALSRDVVQNSEGHYELKEGKRPRPIVLRVNVGDCLQVNFTNRLRDPRPDNNSSATRNASIHVNGLDYRDSILSDGANVGNNPSSLVAPGQSKTYSWYAAKQGQYMINSMGAAAGGEGDGGQVTLGLFGSVNVEPRGSKWYRSQVTAAVLDAAIVPNPPSNLLKIDYEAVFPVGHPDAGYPVLNMRRGNEIVHTDLNAIITDPSGTLQEDCTLAPPSSTCGQPFREFSVIFHDEIKAVQAFEALDEDLFHGVRDGFAINYGSDSLGARLMANRLKVGPAKDCNECKFEEFFLESHVNGDPAVIIKKHGEGEPAEALFPDDPSNVHHSYLNDPVRFLNVHVGPKETHVFHLHAHQWLQSPRDQNSTYLDSQTISPGAAFTYEINYGGSGNRNINPGDAIFHCHLYPHFAQGMWELWRNHDVFERGTVDRNLPDAEIAGGVPTPAVVPIPGKPLPVMPTPKFPGFPHYIAAEVGHRPPQPPFDMEWDGGLQRHIITKAETVDGQGAIDPALLTDPVAARVLATNNDPNPFPPGHPLHNQSILTAFARRLKSAQWRPLEPLGEPEESTAMSFHQGTLFPSVPVTTQYGWQAKGYQTSYPDGTTNQNALFLVNGLPPIAGAPFADPCPAGTFVRPYRAAYVQFDMVVNKYKWHDRQARIAMLEQDALDTNQNPPNPEPLFFRANSGDCVKFSATNLIPGNLNLDDFQIFTPTDTIGQHIHLVKFDVTSSDGAGNGWNYEDGTFSPEDVRERILAIRKFNGCPPLGPPGPYTDPNCPEPAAHPVFGTGAHGEFLGAQTTIQRWWADPLVNNAQKDRTIRTVFTHDHFGPSSHQHHGLYGALVVEPRNSQWKKLDDTPLGGRPDGGPTSFAANIIPPADPQSPTDPPPAFREFNLAFADFAIVYTDDLQPVNPPGRKEADLPIAIEPTPEPHPEAISAADPGTQLVNYRNEPIPLRVGETNQNGDFQQKAGDAGDLAKVFDSSVHQDPFTPILQAYEGDRTIVRLIQGAQEEQHVFNIHGLKWRFEPSVPDSGFRNGQQIGISEHFEFELGPQPESFNKLARRFTDLLYSSAATDNLWDGQWGIMRVYQGLQTPHNTQKLGAEKPGIGALAPLPNNMGGKIANKDPLYNSVCPYGAPERPYSVYAMLARDILPEGALVYNGNNFRRVIYDRDAIIFVNKEDVKSLQSGEQKSEPLILRANAGDCIKVTLSNQLPADVPEHDSWNMMPMIVNRFNFNQVKTSNRVSLHPQLVALDSRSEDGSAVGYNHDSTIGPGEEITYTWYAGNDRLGSNGLPAQLPIEFGAINLRDMGDVIKHASHGAIGSLIIEPPGSTWTFDGITRASSDILDEHGEKMFREFVLHYQDDLSLQFKPIWGGLPSIVPEPLRNIDATDDSEDSGMKAFNYRTEPFWLRLGKNVDTPLEELNDLDYSNVLSSVEPNPGCGGPCGDPATPLFEAEVGTPIRFRVLHPAGHPRQHGFTVFGHHWQFEPWTNNSTALGTNPFTFEVGSYSGIGPTRHENILTNAGGAFQIPGDYLYRTQESFQFSGGGLWGILRLVPKEFCPTCLPPPPPAP